MAHDLGPGFRNRLLGTLPAIELAFTHQAEPVDLKLQQVLFEANTIIEHVYFVESGIVSVLAQTGEDRVEIGLIGHEGMVGVAVAFGVPRTPHQLICQGEGRALRLSAAEFASAAERSQPLLTLLGRYLHYMGVQAGQTAYANAALNVEARLARWILMIHDRTDGFELTLTHQFLAAMLGVRRPGVTTAIHVLEGAGMIRAERGRITVLNRSRLEDLAGDAYGLAEAEYDRLMGPRSAGT